jgi:guanine deaminase
MVTLYKGDIIYAGERDSLSVFPASYIAVESGFVEGIFPVLPEQYQGAKVVDYGHALIIPAFSDLHIHASQYVQRGTGMDKLLFDWLQEETFPQEARFADLTYAESVYETVVREFIRHGTFHLSAFTTLHAPASDLLYRILDREGLYAYVGKVNMDSNSPAFLCESTEESLLTTERFLAEHLDSRTVKPILTPRFAPSCSEPLLKGLGKLAKKYACGLQTHLAESIAEVQWMHELFPSYKSDAELYEKTGLLDNGPVIFAHVIFPEEEDLTLIRRHSAVSVHCPDATANITAGIMPLATLQEQGFRLALGTDVGSGAGCAVYRQIAQAVQLSKLKEFFEPDGNARITFANAFYMATKGGGSVFDRVGSLEKGYRFNALVLDHLEDSFSPLSAEKRLERFCYAGDDRNITARFLDGKQI